MHDIQTTYAPWWSQCRWHAHHFFYHGELDAAVSHFLLPAVLKLLEDRLIDRFFFIRYTLGGPHLRLRYRLAPEVSPVSSAVGEILHLAADRFLRGWPFSGSLDAEQIRRESRAILAMVPEDSELYYENGTLLPFLFEPEWDRYGGRELLELSLDFFAVSSVEALEAIGQPRWRSPGHRGALAFRLLLRQAAGFAVNSKELLSHLGYCLPVAQEIADEIWAKADRDFETHREIHGNLVRHELLSLATAAEVAGGTVRPYVSFLHEAAKRLSQAVRGVPPATRWQIGHSQLHMTANRLGFSPFQEMHLQRILWLAARDLEKGHPITGERIPERFPESGNTAGPSLSRLADSAIDRLRMADRFANAVA